MGSVFVCVCGEAKQASFKVILNGVISFSLCQAKLGCVSTNIRCYRLQSNMLSVHKSIHKQLLFIISAVLAANVCHLSPCLLDCNCD